MSCPYCRRERCPTDAVYSTDRECADALRECREAMAQAQRWISVTPTTMPDEDVTVLLVIDGAVREGCYSAGDWWGSDFTTCDDRLDGDTGEPSPRVTHWRPIVAPEVENG